MRSSGLVRRAAAERRRLATEYRATKTTVRSAGSAMGPRATPSISPSADGRSWPSSIRKRFGRRSSSMSRRQSRSSARRPHRPFCAGVGTETSGDPRWTALALSSSCRALQYQLPLASDATSTQLSRLSAAASPRRALAEIRAFTPVVPPRGRAAPSVLRLRGDERRVAVTRGFLRRRVAAKWGFLRRRCRLRWQESTVSRRRFERRAYRASVPPKVAAPAGPAVPAAARYQRQHFSERGYKFFFLFFFTDLL